MTETQRRSISIRHLVEHHQEALWLWLRTIGAEGNLAEDICQEAFLILLRKPWQQWPNAQIAGFLRGTGKNLLMARNAKHARRHELLAQHAESLWERLLPDNESEELRANLLSCVNTLPERERSIIRDFYLKELAGPALCKQREMTEAALYGLMHRARKRLRECIEGKMEKHHE